MLTLRVNCGSARNPVERTFGDTHFAKNHTFRHWERDGTLTWRSVGRGELRAEATQAGRALGKGHSPAVSFATELKTTNTSLLLRSRHLTGDSAHRPLAVYSWPTLDAGLMLGPSPLQLSPPSTPLVYPCANLIFSLQNPCLGWNLSNDWQHFSLVAFSTSFHLLSWAKRLTSET